MDDDDTVEFPAITDDDDDGDGPACGTAAALVYFLATFNDATGVRFLERHCCCFRHVPRPADVLPRDAQLIEVVVQDSWTRTVVRNGQAEITVSGSDEAIVCPVQLLS
jgi:hypothetical protein